MTDPSPQPTPVHTYDLGAFPLECGVTLPDARIAYCTYGTLSDARDNAILFPTWFIGDHTNLEWLIGEGEPLDTTRYFVIVAHMFANGYSSSPSNTPAPYDRSRFPAITIRDNVHAQHRLITDHFGLSTLPLVIGGSMGALQAYQWAVSYPEMVQRIHCACGAATVSRHCYVFLDGARAALMADPTLKGGDYDAFPEVGMKAQGRVWAGWALSQAFYRERLYTRMGFESVDAFLSDFWEAFWMSCEPNNLLSQLHTWQTADLGASPGFEGDTARALASIKAKAMLTPGQTDLYFPPEDMQWEAEQMADAECRPIPGPWGHFSEVGIDPDCNRFLGQAIRDLLAR